MSAAEKRSIPEMKDFPGLIRELSPDPKTQEMKHFRQHGKVSTYDHCMDVAKTSYLLGSVLHIPVFEQELVRGAFLHDYFLYDWHHHDNSWHGLTHPEEAAKNAERDFSISELERDIIESHMWPLTLRTIPHSREAVLVCVADKICSVRETLLHRR